MLNKQQRTLVHKVNPNLIFDGGPAGIEDPNLIVDETERLRYDTGKVRYISQKRQQTVEDYQLDQYKD
ncbi:MAG: hypothetical protein V1663_03260 [archaeon]